MYLIFFVKVFGKLIDYMYTGNLTISIENVEDILIISDFLLLDDVKEYCKQFYLDLGNIDLTNCLRLRFLAEHHNLMSVAEVCQELIISRFHDHIIHGEEILEIPPRQFFQLLENPLTVQHTSFLDLKKAILRWIDHSPQQRQLYYTDLCACIKLWLCELASECNLHRHNMELYMHLSLSEVMNERCGQAVCLLKENVLHESMNVHDTVCPVLYALVCNPGMKALHIMVYNINSHNWFKLPINTEKMLQMIPARHSICSMTAHNNYLYMYLCPSFPYPSDMMKIHILVFDLLKCQPIVYTFKTADHYNPGYRTTQTNVRSLPPATVVCGHDLYLVGNKEGAGNLFQCSLNNHLYKCHQISGARFISLARVAVKGERFIYLWFRHRTGPSEEFCIKKSVGFVMFDIKAKSFSSWEITPPDISYEDFAKPYTLCVRDDTLLIHHPGQHAIVLDEIRCKWVISLRRLPDICTTTDTMSDSYQIQTCTENGIFSLNNPAPFTTTMQEVNEMYPKAFVHKPPPIDNISLVSSGYLTSSHISQLTPIDHYDESYTNSLHVTMRFSDADTDESGCEHNTDNDSDNDFEYDEEIYDYNFEGDFGFSL